MTNKDKIQLKDSSLHIETDKKIMGKTLQPGLYLVPTPIGNLEDMTQRAIRILQQADIIACEDTRRTGQLLKQFGIQKKKLSSYHEHNEKEKAKQLANELLAGKTVALVSDAGTPAISDPGYRIIKTAIENDIKIISLPGATAFAPALAASGIPINNFLFLGFPPQKKGRKSFLKKISNLEWTIVLYESPYRILKLIDELIEYCGGERQICIAREISKIYEEFIRGTLLECREALLKKPSIKGEFVVVIEGKKD